MKGVGYDEFYRYLLGARPASAQSFSQAPDIMPSGAFQPPPQAAAENVPLPRARPPVVQQAQSAPQKPPLSLAPPSPGPAMSFSGEKGPQWSDQEWQNFWARSNPEGLMGYYPVQA